MNLSSPGIAIICMARSSDSAFPFSVRFAETSTFGYFVVISTVAFFPDETMIFGLENTRASSVDSSARSVRYISLKLSVPLK